jgi:hypothetical protein
MMMMMMTTMTMMLTLPLITYFVEIQSERFVFLHPCLIPPATQTNIVCKLRATVSNSLSTGSECAVASGNFSDTSAQHEV